MDVMATEKDRLTITHDQELREKLDRVKEIEGFDADADVGRQLLRRGLDDWQRERATYPGSDLVERGIEVSAVGFVVALMVTISTSGGVALGESMALAAVVIGFVGAHYAALLMQQRGEI